MKNYRFIIDGTPPSNNKYIGRMDNFNKYQKEKELWHWKLKAAIKKRPEKPLKKAIVTICYFFKDNRRRDPDNYSGKFILDPLVKEGIIRDDSFDVIDLEIKKGGVDSENPHTIIEVIEIES